MSALTLVATPTDFGRPLVQAYRRLLGVPFAQRVMIGVLGPVLACGVCVVANQPPAAGLLVWLLGVSVVSDLLWRRIFNWITGPALLAVAVGQLVGLLRPDFVNRVALPDWETSLAGFGVCFGLMLFLWFAFQGGEGDVKLIAVLGAVLGPRDGIEVAVAGYLLAAVVALGILGVRLVRRAVGRSDPGRPFAAGTLPMAPFFALAALLIRPTLGGA